MRVHYDDQIMTRQQRGGVSRYFVELVEAYRQDPGLGVSVDLDWRSSRNEHAVAAGLGRQPSRYRRRLRRLARRLPSMPPRHPDIYHPTWYDADRLSPKPGPPMVVTVVDMIPEVFPDLFAGGNPHYAKEDFVRQASAVVCISDNTRRDLLRVYGPLSAVVEVVPLAVGPEFLPGQPLTRSVPDDYLLFVGKRGGYKDFVVALEAFARIRTEHPNLSLIAVGGGKFGQQELAAIQRHAIEDFVLRLEATDEELPALYGASRAFVFPSRYEGFGLPTLEAMACGTPVVLADSSSHPEVGGDAALYFPPGDASVLGLQVLRILGDVELRGSLVERGLERAAAFTWHRTAAQTRDVYARVAEPR